MRVRPLVGALVLCILGASASGCAVGADPGSTPPSTTEPTAATGAATSGAAGAPASEAERVGSVVPQPPNEIQLPNGKKMYVRAVSTTRNGLLDVPTDIRAAGWWQGGSLLGDPFGSTLVAAHVDSRTQGLGPFVALLSVKPGDQVVVWSRGLRQVFRVDTLRLRPRNTIGPGSPLFSPRGSRRLTLVTCAGPYVLAKGGYQNLAVVTAVPVGDPVSRTAA